MQTELLALETRLTCHWSYASKPSHVCASGRTQSRDPQDGAETACGADGGGP